MEQEGWNYEHANPDGKTVFILRDTGHIVPEIQEKLLKEADRLIKQHFFNNLFVEGCQGEYVSGFYHIPSEELVKQEIQKEMGKWSAMDILAYRFRKEISNGFFRMYGVEDKILFERQKNAAKRVSQLGVKFLKKQDTSEERLEFDRELQLFYSLSYQRSQAAVDMLVKQMGNLSINTAGLNFGDGHYKDMTKLLKQKGIGYISYFPGKPDIPKESALEYALNL